VVLHVLKSEGLASSVKIVSQQPATNLVFVRALGGVLSRPTVFPFQKSGMPRAKGSR